MMHAGLIPPPPKRRHLAEDSGTIVITFPSAHEKPSVSVLKQSKLAFNVHPHIDTDAELEVQIRKVEKLVRVFCLTQQ